MFSKELIMIKIKIISESGAIEGWFVALCETVAIYLIWLLSMFWEPVTKSLEKTGGFITGIYAVSFGAWLAYKGAKTIWGQKEEGK